jgi:hypothetical protein
LHCGNVFAANRSGKQSIGYQNLPRARARDGARAHHRRPASVDGPRGTGRLKDGFFAFNLESCDAPGQIYGVMAVAVHITTQVVATPFGAGAGGSPPVAQHDHAPFLPAPEVDARLMRHAAVWEGDR